MPIPISNISTDNHKVVVGLSDAYYYDEYIGSGIVELLEFYEHFAFCSLISM